MIRNVIKQIRTVTHTEAGGNEVLLGPNYERIMPSKFVGWEVK